jgi:DNA-3-methyladenine glycosylase I
MARCFGDDDPLMAEYHDVEWGRPVHGDRELFERIALEGFQAGLSWQTVLRKRPAFREVFYDFDPVKVAAMSDADVERLVGVARIIRNRAKITATINNANALLAMQENSESLDELFWSHRPEKRHPRRRPGTDTPTTSPEAVALAKALKKKGFKFFGPTTAYAAMQACGLVDDHLTTCKVPPAG